MKKTKKAKPVAYPLQSVTLTTRRMDKLRASGKEPLVLVHQRLWYRSMRQVRGDKVTFAVPATTAAELLLLADKHAKLIPKDVLVEILKLKGYYSVTEVRKDRPEDFSVVGGERDGRDPVRQPGGGEQGAGAADADRRVRVPAPVERGRPGRETPVGRTRGPAPAPAAPRGGGGEGDDVGDEG